MATLGAPEKRAERVTSSRREAERSIRGRGELKIKAEEIIFNPGEAEGKHVWLRSFLHLHYGF